MCEEQLERLPLMIVQRERVLFFPLETLRDHCDEEISHGDSCRPWRPKLRVNDPERLS